MSDDPQNPYAVSATNQPPLSPADERTWGILVHVIAIFAGLISAIILYVLFRGRGPFVRAHTTTELNFQITILALSFIGAAVMIGSFFSLIGTNGHYTPPIGFFLGYALILVTSMLRLIFGVIASIQASRGNFYRYPVAIPFIR